jgi:hypothetical protein
MNQLETSYKSINVKKAISHKKLIMKRLDPGAKGPVKAY